MRLQQVKRARSSTGQKGMTLVEIMVVIAIIGMVMGAVVVGAMPALEKARCKTAWGETQTVLQAIATYQTENNGDAPKGLEELVTGKFLSKKPMDPWGQEIMIGACPGTNNADNCDVHSKGKDKQDGSGDDVESWVTQEDAVKKCISKK